MKDSVFTVNDNRMIARDVYRMELKGDTSQISAPGQFVNIRIEGRFLRRPISVCDKQDDTLVIIYKVAGDGTQDMSRMLPGKELDILTGLGHGYDLDESGERPLLAGGGVGVPPLYWLCRQLTQKGARPFVVLGFNRADEVFYEQEFKSLGADVKVMTVDGSYGDKGFVTDGMNGIDYSYIYTCGPMPMLRAVNAAAQTSGQFSFEERMGCGFGACMGCSCHTLAGDKRICTDGPVMRREEIIW